MKVLTTKTSSVGTQTDLSHFGIDKPQLTTLIKRHDNGTYEYSIKYDPDELRPHFAELLADTTICLLGRLKNKILSTLGFGE